MWRFKYLLIGMLFPALIGLGLYLLAPRVSDFFKDSISNAASDDVAEIFQRETPNQVDAGQIVISENQLTAIITNPANDDDTWYQDNMRVQIQDGKVQLITSDNNRTTIVYSVVPEVVNGRLVLTNRSGVLRVFKTAQNAISDEIENQASTLFSNSSVTPVSVTAEDGRLVIVTEASSGGTTTTPKPTATP